MTDDQTYANTYRGDVKNNTIRADVIPDMGPMSVKYLKKDNDDMCIGKLSC